MPSSQFRTPRLEFPQLVNLQVSPGRPPSSAVASHTPTLRARPECASPAVEIVTSHVETLIERITGVDKAVPDNDGDYPVRFRDALYWVRVSGNEEQPLVTVFSHVLSNLTPSPDLYEAVNQINTRLGFCWCYFVQDHVVIEAEHLGFTIRTHDFRELTQNVAVASDYFGSMLSERFGGKLPFDSDSHHDEAVAATPPPGLYL